MRITTQNDGVTVVIRPRGEIDFAVLPELLTAAHQLPPGVTHVIWNMQEARFMDVAALHLLVQQQLECVATGRTLAVTGLHYQPQRLLELAKELFPAWDWDDFLPRDLPLTRSSRVR
ncbi:STAS domain-containing protein [Streptomyces sp. V4-01]|uniref:STAS domain-containing protein n=1 Tax=Actinacidiphila polyblastidii TaxID=3110430 RepID=A0ABU7PDT2_9ACTN|nr:STAS domain-containing protein [Streptomyces sp. V4-01]